ncbi:hypothetical protein [Bacillus gobiensis]|uniref:Uncharacterized protein n=1 Tax=Bacillus gobiensis TaxID=1441095 RepID=A0A0M3R8X3_9BACI|nr:hypothetical protein [Bacillus gobiensis]ALC80432.1 hypothetical protein AM592_01655 [Bacillus gobiensis]
MNWDNIFKTLEKYTQYKHYLLLFDQYKLPRKQSRDEMSKVLHEAVTDEGFIGSIMSETAMDEWLALHQKDGNNYSFVYNLQEKIQDGLLNNLYVSRNKYIKLRLWDINPHNESEDLNSVMPNLTDITLVGIHRNENAGTYTFSFVSPCEVTGSRADGSTRVFKKVFFSHCVFFDNSNDVKVIFNPTSNLQHVNGVRKERFDWTPIANMVFNKVQEYIGGVLIVAPNWIPQALYKFAEEATSHNNPKITAASFNAQEMIEEFAAEVLKQAGVDTINEPALISRLIQDIQISFESQLFEIYSVEEEKENSLTIFKQRSDGITHIISVESTEEGFKIGPAAQAARRSRQDGDIDLLGVNLKTNDRMYKFLVEQGTDAYLIRGTNTFIEEEVVNIVIRRLNEYRTKIQVAAERHIRSEEGTSFPEAK